MCTGILVADQVAAASPPGLREQLTPSRIGTGGFRRQYRRVLAVVKQELPLRGRSTWRRNSRGNRVHSAGVWHPRRSCFAARSPVAGRDSKEGGGGLHDSLPTAHGVQASRCGQMGFAADAKYGQMHLLRKPKSLAEMQLPNGRSLGVSSPLPSVVACWRTWGASIRFPQYSLFRRHADAPPAAGRNRQARPLRATRGAETGTGGLSRVADGKGISPISP